MVLEEFVKDTLLQIIKGVKSAQDEADAFGAVVSPSLSSEDVNTVKIHDKSRTVTGVDFDVVLTESVSSKGDAKVSVGFMHFAKVGAEGGDAKENGVRTSVKFSVPVALPGYDNANTPMAELLRRKRSGDGMTEI
jgi:hypothetical protein